MAEQLSEGTDLRLAAAGASSAGTAGNGAVVDMQGFDGVRFFGTIATANAGNYLKVQQGDASDLSDAADLEGTKAGAAANGSVVCVDVIKPKERYLRGVFIRGGANTATGDMYYERYNAASKPTVAQGANTLVTTMVRSPAEGTP